MRLESRYYLFAEASFVFVIHCVVFWWMFGVESLPIGVDGYFHFTIASQLGFSNPVQNIEALPFTLLGETGPDHHWLIHWLQKPITVLFSSMDSEVALAAIVWAALVPAFLCAILRSYLIPFAPIIAVVGVWGLYILPDRLLMFRAQNAAIIMVVTLTLLMSAQRYLWVGVFVFFFNHAYQGVVLAGAVGFSALLAQVLANRRFDRLLISSATAGFLLSLFTSPWFPDNIRYLIVVMMGRIVFPFNNMALMGIEWLPLGLGTLLRLGPVGHVCLILAWMILARQWRCRAGTAKFKRALTFTILSTVFLILYTKHWRMGEFYGPLSAMAFGFCIPLVARKVLVTLMVLFVSILAGIHQYLQRPQIEVKFSAYAAHCGYLNKHAKAGELVFNLPWGAFPLFYRCAPDLKYISGLDGMLLSQGDHEVFRTWYYLYQFDLEHLDAEEVSSVLTRTGSDYILLEPGDETTKDWLLNNVTGSSLVHSDTDGYLIALSQ